MSSVIAIQQTDAIHLITDGASYDHDGVMIDVRSKVVHLPAANCILATRGGNWAGPALEGGLAIIDSFDTVAEALPMIMRLAATGYRHAAEVRGEELHPLDTHFEVTIAGWSDRMQRMAALVASTFAIRDPLDTTGLSHAAGYVPYTPWLPVQGYSQPPLDWSHVLSRQFVTQDEIDALDPVVDGLELFEAQRNEGGVYFGRAAYLVGGFAELTTVRRSGVESQVLRRYPDRVGKKITPESAPPIKYLQAVIDAHQALTEANDQLALARKEAFERSSLEAARLEIGACAA